jgi:hypothetical protein
MPDGRTDDARQVALLCVSLPRLQTIADEAGWRADLDAAIADMHAGMPVEEAVTKQGIALPDLSEVGRNLMSLKNLGIPPVPVNGTYRCPRANSCRRTADRDSHTKQPPRCHLVEGGMMTFTPQ